jgi:serine/threonine protein phosphatase PrpC
MPNFNQVTSAAPPLLDFIRALAAELRTLHGENLAHGAVTGNGQQWLDDARKTFDPEKFKQTIVPTDADPHTAIPNDTAGFIQCAKCWLTGADDPTENDFKDAIQRNRSIPKAFLTLLASPLGDGNPYPTISECCEALDAPVEPDPEVPAPADMPKPAPALSSIPFSIALRNGTVGKPYEIEPSAIAEAIATQRKDDPVRARISHLQLPDDCGLAFNEQTGAVTGIPKRPLEEQLHLDYVPSPNAESVRCKVSLLINPDPASLWKDLAPNTDAPYQKESVAHDEFNFPGFRVVAASRRGRSHANRGDFRDDDYAVGFAEATGWLVVVVADGAGSAKYSRKGSEVASKAACDRLVAVLSGSEYAEVASPRKVEGSNTEIKPRKWLGDLLYDAALHAHYKIKEEVDKPGAPLPEPPTIRNYDTTLILLLVKKLERGCYAATFSIGDGGAGILHSPTEAEPLTHSDSGEHAGQTTFVTIASTLSNDPDNIAKRFKMTTALDFTAALAMTDGITDPKFPSDADFADASCWASLWNEIEPTLGSSEALLEWMNFFSPGNHDDRTLVAVLPATPTTTPAG